MEKVKNYMESLNGNVLVSKKLLFFEVLSAVLGGIVIGFVLAPPKSVNVMSNNGCNNDSSVNGLVDDMDEE